MPTLAAVPERDGPRGFEMVREGEAVTGGFEPFSAVVLESVVLDLAFDGEGELLLEPY